MKWKCTEKVPQHEDPQIITRQDFCPLLDYNHVVKLIHKNTVSSNVIFTFIAILRLHRFFLPNILNFNHIVELIPKSEGISRMPMCTRTVALSKWFKWGELALKMGWEMRCFIEKGFLLLNFRKKLRCPKKTNCFILDFGSAKNSHDKV